MSVLKPSNGFSNQTSGTLLLSTLHISTSNLVGQVVETSPIPEPSPLRITSGANLPRGKAGGQLQFPEVASSSALRLAHNEVQRRSEAQLLWGTPSCFDVEGR